MPPLLVFIFLSILAVVLVAIAAGWAFLEKRRKTQVEKMLVTVEGKPQELGRITILKKQEEETLLTRLLTKVDVRTRLQDYLSQGGLDWTPEAFAMASLAAAIAGGFAGTRLNSLLPLGAGSIAGAVLFSLFPLLIASRRRASRFRDFEEQFPEALDFMARSMRSGHAFSVSLEMIGEESPEPLAAEFRQLFNEQNLGAPLEVAFAGLVRRVPLTDVRFFVSAVMLQRQTGGNLSEILTRLAYIIRERFRLRGQVRAASAHGRMTAGILTAMPIVLMFALLFVAPGYLEGMANDSDGKYLILGAVVAQVLGFLVIRRIIDIKV